MLIIDWYFSKSCCFILEQFPIGNDKSKPLTLNCDIIIINRVYETTKNT